MNEDISQIQQAIQESRQLAAQGNYPNALLAAKRACLLVDDLEMDGPLPSEAGAAAYAELGLLLQRLGDSRRALDAYKTADERIRRLPYETGPSHYRLLVATTAINMAGLYTKQRLLEAAASRIDEALALLPVGDDLGGAVAVLRLGALNNRASIDAEQGNPEKAEVSLREALELGEGAISETPQVLPQLIEVSGRLANALKAQKRFDDAIDVATKGSRWAEAAYDAGSPVGVGLYVQTQLQQVDLCFAAGRYAQGEDHVWKAVEVSTGPQTLLVGAGFYASILRLSPKAADAGGLPRTEVVDAMSELMDKMDAEDAPSDLMLLIRARYAVLVESDAASGRAALEAAEKAGPSVRQLATALAADLRWLEAEAEGENP
jgi:tetratricopeptide (TPR) repeat protein